MPLQQDISVQVHNIVHMEDDKLCTSPYVLLDSTLDTYKNPLGLVLNPNLAAEKPNKMCHALLTTRIVNPNIDALRP